MKNNRKAFTLIELLIVIVVIGILSSMMLLSSLEAINSADTATVISNLTNLKKAATLWYMDNLHRVKPIKHDGQDDYHIIFANGTEDYFSKFIKDGGGNKEILKYFDNGSSITLGNRTSAGSEGDYAIIAVNGTKNWYVCYNVGSDERTSEKLASKSGSLGLIGLSDINISDLSNPTPYSSQKYVCMPVLSL